MAYNKRLAKLWEENSDLLPKEYNWEDEKDRENELYFCILESVIGDTEEYNLREIANSLGSLKLFDTEALSVASQLRQDAKSEGDLLGLVIKAALIQSGVPKQKAEKSTKTICEAAKVINEQYEGKIQKFLRKYTQQMVDELSQTFSFSDKELDKKALFSFWLQNVFEAPLLRVDEDMKNFLKKEKITEDVLLEAADDLDINAMVIDDLLRLASADGEKRKST